MPLLVSMSLHWLYNFSTKGFLETTFTTANRIDQQWKIFIKFIVTCILNSASFGLVRSLKASCSLDQ